MVSKTNNKIFGRLPLIIDGISVIFLSPFYPLPPSTSLILAFSHDVGFY